jgi:putative endonuclease
VAAWYAARGYRVLARNWRCSSGELDLVVLHEATGTLACCEVKTRTSGVVGSPFEAITPMRLRRLRRLVGRYLAEARPPGVRLGGVRLDVASVRPGAGGSPVVEVLEDVGS